MAARPRTLPAAIAPVLVGSAAVVYEVGELPRVGAFFAALVGSIFIQVGTNLVNDYSDAKRGADTVDRLGPVRVTAAGLVAPRSVLVATWVAFGIAMVAGIYLATVAGPEILAVGAVSILAGVLYTAGPRPYGYAGLGELFVFVFFGLVAVNGSYYVQLEELDLLPLGLSISVGLLATAILVVNNVRDIDTDRRAGKNTLAVRLGRERTRRLYVALIALAYIAPSPCPARRRRSSLGAARVAVAAAGAPRRDPGVDAYRWTVTERRPRRHRGAAGCVQPAGHDRAARRFVGPSAPRSSIGPCSSSSSRRSRTRCRSASPTSRPAASSASASSCWSGCAPTGSRGSGRRRRCRSAAAPASARSRASSSRSAGRPARGRLRPRPDLVGAGALPQPRRLPARRWRRSTSRCTTSPRRRRASRSGACWARSSASRSPATPPCPPPTPPRSAALAERWVEQRVPHLQAQGRLGRRRRPGRERPGGARARTRSCGSTPTAPGRATTRASACSRWRATRSSSPRSRSPASSRLASLRRRTGIPLAADESLVTTRDAREAVGWAPATSPRSSSPRSAGSWPRSRSPRELPAYLSSALEGPVGIAAAVHAARRSPASGDDGLAHGLATEQLFSETIGSGRGGRRRPAASRRLPGLGVELDEEALAARRI